jgi:hypothetical protein
MSDETKDILFRDMAMRLPYGVKVQWEDHGHKTNQKIVGCGTGHVTFDVTEHDSFEECSTEHTILHYDSIKPILRPFSDIYEVIIHKGKSFIPSDLLESDDYHTDFIADTMYDYLCDMVEGLLGLQFLPHGLVLQFIEWHLDVNGLIPKGLAIDVNTLETNPYQ